MDCEKDLRSAVAEKSAKSEALLRQELSPRLVEARDVACRNLLELLTLLFDRADDALFDMAERAVGNREQTAYFEAMRELRLGRRRIEMDFAQNLGATFDRIGTAPVVTEPAAAGPVQLTLVEDNEIEEVVAVSSMVARAKAAYFDELALLSMRFESLLAGVRLADEENPLAPQPVCDAFVQACSILDIDVKARLFILKLFEKYVFKSLGKIYRGVNEQLANAGVLTNISLADQASRRADTGTAERAASESYERSGSESDFGQVDEGLFNRLQSLLMRAGVKPASRERSSESAVKIIRRVEALELLSRLQRVDMDVATDETGYACELPPQQDICAQLAQELDGLDDSECFELCRSDEDAIELVTRLFDFVLDDANLAQPLKTHLLRLKLPMAKVALLDTGLFGKYGHPARKLLNVMAEASVGWEPLTNASRDFFYRKIKQTVDTVLEEFDDDIEVFQRGLADFNRFVENERRRASIVEQRMMETEQGKARSEAARNHVAEVIERCALGKQLPDVVRQLLEDAWSKVLFLVYVREGDGSATWKNAVRVMEELIWSVQPKFGEAQCQRLQRLVPNLHKSLRVGLNRVGVGHFAVNQFSKQLDAIYKNVVEQQAAPETAPTGSPGPAARAGSECPGGECSAPPPGSGEPSECAADASGGSEVSLAAVEASILELVDQLRLGSWVQFNQGAEANFRARLAAIMPQTGKYIFVNRAGKKVEEWGREELAVKISENVVQLLDDSLLFDRALESVIRQLQAAD